MAAAVAGSRAALPGLLEGLDSTLPQDWNRRTTGLNNTSTNTVIASYWCVLEVIIAYNRTEQSWYTDQNNCSQQSQTHSGLHIVTCPIDNLYCVSSVLVFMCLCIFVPFIYCYCCVLFSVHFCRDVGCWLVQSVAILLFSNFVWFQECICRKSLLYHKVICYMKCLTLSNSWQIVSEDWGWEGVSLWFAEIAHCQIFK